MPFFTNQKVGGQLGPLRSIFFPKLLDQTFELVILLEIVETCNELNKIKQVFLTESKEQH